MTRKRGPASSQKWEEKKRRRVHGQVRRGSSTVSTVRSKRGMGATGWAGVCVCMADGRAPRPRVHVVGSRFGGWNVWRRETASPDRNRCQKNELALVRAPLSLVFVRPASSQLHFPGSQHRFPISFQINLPGPFFPPSQRLFFSTWTFCQMPTYMKRARLVPLSVVLGANQNHHLSTDKTSNMSPASLPFCKGQSHPCHRQVREKKGARGQEEGAAVGREDCSRYPAPGRGGAVECRLQMGADRICSSALSFLLFPPPPQRRLGSSDIISSLSPLPQHPFVEGCTSTRRVHNVVSRGGGTMSAHCLPTGQTLSLDSRQ